MTLHHYIKEEDIFKSFFDDCSYFRVNRGVYLRDAYIIFQEWWKNNLKHPCPSMKKFKKWMDKIFKDMKKGNTVYMHIVFYRPKYHVDLWTIGK